MTSNSLKGHCILLADDESLDPSDTEAQLSQAGAAVLLAHNVYQILLVASEHELTAAVLDAELESEVVERVAPFLRGCGVPVLFVKSNSRGQGRCRDGKASVLRRDQLVEGLANLQ